MHKKKKPRTEGIERRGFSLERLRWAQCVIEASFSAKRWAARVSPSGPRHPAKKSPGFQCRGKVRIKRLDAI